MKNFKIIIPVGLILIITFAAFYPCLKNGFVNWDDDLYVTKNAVIKDFSLNGLKQIFTSFFVANYQPATILSYLFEYRFFKLEPFGYHLTNLIMHLCNCLLVFWLIYMLTRKVSISSLTALLFGIHPLHVESVVWVSERKDVLYALFFLAAAISYCYYLRERKARRYYILSLGLFVLSLLSKPMAVTLPFVLLLIDYFDNRKVDKGMFIDKIPFFVLSFIFGAIAIFGHHSGGFIRKSLFPGALGIMSGPIYSILFYINKILAPIKLSCFYTYDGTGSLSVGIYSLGLLFILLSGVIISGKYTRKIIFGSMFFLAVSLPILQFIPIGETIVADRYTYIASIGIFYIFAEGCGWLYKKTRYSRIYTYLLVLAFVIIIVVLGTLTQKRCQIWKDSIVLWNDVISNHPTAVTAYNNRGTELLARKEYDKAYADFVKAIELNPKYAKAYYNRGVVYDEQGDFTRAFSDYNKAIEINPNYFDAYYNRGILYHNQGDLTRAISDYTRAIETNPNYAGSYNNRGVTYFMAKEYDKAWIDVYKVEALGYAINPEFLTELKKASGRGKNEIASGLRPSQ